MIVILMFGRRCVVQTPLSAVVKMELETAIEASSLDVSLCSSTTAEAETVG